MNTELIGTAAGLLSCITFLPQVIRTWRSRSVRDVSPLMFIIATISTLLWLVYGILIRNFPVIFTNSIVGSLSFIMLFLMFRFRNNQ